MRKTFIKTLITLAEKDDSIYLLVNDTGFSYVEEFRDKFPDRYYNSGISEQAGMSMAAGLGLQGKKVFYYGIESFLLRCLEQIRNDVVYHKSNVTIVGTFSERYKLLGFTHYCPEILDIFESIKLNIISPPDKESLEEWMLNNEIKYNYSPHYLRLVD